MWVSAVSGVPLFDASAKYNSGTGWPSFFQPVDPVRYALLLLVVGVD